MSLRVRVTLHVVYEQFGTVRSGDSRSHPQAHQGGPQGCRRRTFRLRRECSSATKTQLSQKMPRCRGMSHGSLLACCALQPWSGRKDYKAAAAAVPVPLMSPTISNESHGSHHVSKPITSIAARPVVTAPQPLRPLDRRPSLGAPATHARSPSAGTGLQDQAQGAVKKGLNQLMTLLDKGGNMKDFAGRSDNALRSVRAKREADEASTCLLLPRRVWTSSETACVRRQGVQERRTLA